METNTQMTEKNKEKEKRSIKSILKTTMNTVKKLAGAKNVQVFTFLLFLLVMTVNKFV